MVSITRTVDVEIDVNLDNFASNELIQELDSRGDLPSEDQGPWAYDDDILIRTIEQRGYGICRSEALTLNDIELIIKLLPDHGPGSQLYFIMEKLEELKAYAKF